MAKKKLKSDIRDRVVGFERISKDDIEPHPLNWRIHSETQRQKFRSILSDVGFASAIVARKTESGRVQILDGHMRFEEHDGDTVPVLLVDLSDEEAERLLATFDWIGAQASADETVFRQILDKHSQDLEDVFGDQIKLDQLDGNVELSPVTPQDPPECTWVLIGIPTVKFHDIALLVESLADRPNVIVKITSNSDNINENNQKR